MSSHTTATTSESATRLQQERLLRLDVRYDTPTRGYACYEDFQRYSLPSIFLTTLLLELGNLRMEMQLCNRVHAHIQQTNTNK